MALEMVAGSFLNSFLSVLFDRIASREVVNYFKGKKLDGKLLEKLKITMRSVIGVLDDAEEKQITKPAVKDWLDDLKDATYEADDLLDEIAYEALRLGLTAAGSGKQKVRKFFSYLKPYKNESKLEAKLEEVYGRFELLVKQINVLGLVMRQGFGEKPSSHKTPTTSLLDDDFGIYGRDDDKEVILELLLSNDAGGNHKLGVIPIVGMGGVGKTTLAQFVYNDNRVQEWFELKAWICISEEFDICKVVKDILQKVNQTASNTDDLDQLQHGIKAALTGKKFLIVLDDVWNDKYTDWDILRTPLKVGAEGSKIIITTRNESVALVMDTVGAHRVNALTDDHCWSLFSEHAFGSGNFNQHSELQCIGKEMIKRCKGLPLAAKTIGGLLRSRRDPKEWEIVLNSNMWNLPNSNILPALRLSYHYLPSHLKRCFAYCAIFPKDYQFQKDELVHLWMAEGFLDQPKKNEVMEEVGDNYFFDLVSRSFFQQASKHGDSYFIMHDLIHDLAKDVSGEFSIMLDDVNSGNFGRRTRHLSQHEAHDHLSNKFEVILDLQVLRTFIVTNYYTSYKDIHDLLPKLKRLRVLSLHGYFYNITKLPDSVSDLKHLRYLDLSGASIKCLPKSLCDMYYLETLILSWCSDLLDLPTNLSMLVNLCHLDIKKTRLEQMPQQMGKLTKLLTLSDFFVGKQGGSGLNELGELQRLRGGLRIWNLQNVVDVEGSSRTCLKNKDHLKKLKLIWFGDADDKMSDRRVLEQLQPSVNMESLSICGYGGYDFPVWVGNSSFSKIVSLKLKGCKYCSSLPPLGQLTSLEYLCIKGFRGVVTVDSEFYGSDNSTMKPFGSLKPLRFEDMPWWREWISYTEDGDKEGDAFPVLEELYIRRCPGLTNLITNRLLCLTTLETWGCEGLLGSLPGAPNICDLTLSNQSRSVKLRKLPSGLHRLTVSQLSIPYSLDLLLEEMELMCGLSNTLGEIDFCEVFMMECFPLELFPNLEYFKIGQCPNLKSFSATGEPLRDLMFLSSFSIYKCSNFVSFPKGGLPAPNLKSLSLIECPNLKALPECMHSLLTSLLELEIHDCSEIESFPDGGLPSKLQSLWIENCSVLKNWDLQNLSCLSRLTIPVCELGESFPGEILLPFSLTSLCISKFCKLKSLSYEGLQFLTSLIELEVQHCPKLQSIPEEGLPCSLSSLHMSDCPLLEERFQGEKGEDWSKIAHIPSIKINGEEI